MMKWKWQWNGGVAKMMDEADGPPSPRHRRTMQVESEYSAEALTDVLIIY
jgi:hypothetical protein